MTRIGRTRWGAVYILSYRRILWGVAYSLMTDSWDIYLWPFAVRVNREALWRSRGYVRKVGRDIGDGFKGAFRWI